MIPAAAFIVTATGVSAFNTDLLDKIDIDLTEEQISTLEELHENKPESREEAKEKLEAVGLTKEIMHELHGAVHEAHKEQHEAIKATIASRDYEAFKEVANGSPIAEMISTETEFNLLADAHEHMQSGDREEAREIFDELDIKGPGHRLEHESRVHYKHDEDSD
ncbi:hypothetical protein CL653_02835 [bacterium]|nr:hypothetical protein [bacterium]